jgi:hypothetical protein
MEPNTIVIADSTRRQVGSVFALEDLGFKRREGLYRAPTQRKSPLNGLTGHVLAAGILV